MKQNILNIDNDTRTLFYNILFFLEDRRFLKINDKELKHYDDLLDEFEDLPTY